MLNVLILDFGRVDDRVRAVRDALERIGCETLVLRIDPAHLGHDTALIRARWRDCDLALVRGAPAALLRALGDALPRPIVHLSPARDGLASPLASHT